MFMLDYIRRIFAWWRDELSSFVPVRVRRLFSGSISIVAVDYLSDSLVLRRQGVDGEPDQAIARIDLPDGGSTAGGLSELRTGVENLLADAVGKNPTIALSLPSEQIFSRTVTMPAAAAENLRQVMRYDLERRTPFKPDDVYFDVHVAGLRAASGEVDARLHVVPRRVLDDAVEALEKLGLHPVRAGIVPGAAGAGSETVNFLPPARRDSAPKGLQVLTGGLAAVVAALLFFTAYVPLEKERLRSVKLAEELTAVRKRASVSVRLEDELQKAAKRARFIQERKARAPAMVRVLKDLTLLIPDKTWLFQFQIKDGQVAIQGHSTAASTLIETIERGRLFGNAGFRSGLARNPKTGLERFHITFDLKAEAPTAVRATTSGDAPGAVN